MLPEGPSSSSTEQWISDWARFLLAAGSSSITPSHSSPTADGEPPPVSSLRLALRSVGEVLEIVLWGHGLNTCRGGALTGLGVSHCLIDVGVVSLCAEASLEGRGEVVVLEGSGMAAPLGAHAAGWGDNGPSRLFDLLAFAGVVSVWSRAAIIKNRHKSPRSQGIKLIAALLHYTDNWNRTE